MDITIKKQKDTSIVATAVIAEDERAVAEAKALQTLAPKVKLKGFRPGKAPSDMIKASISPEDLLEETVRALLPDLLKMALEKSGAKPILQPHVGIESLKPLTVAMTFVEKPKVTLRKPGNIRVEKKKFPEISSEEIEKFILRMLSHDRTETEVDRPSKKGDAVRVSLSAKDGAGKELKTLTVPNYVVTIGTEELIPELSDPLNGVKKGEKKQAKITFPKTHEITELREKDATIEIEVKSVSEVRYPELTAEFLKSKLRVEKTPEEFRKDVLDGLTHQKRDEEMKRREEELMKQTRESTEVELPALLIDSEVRMILGEFEERLKSQGATLERWLQSRNKKPEDFVKELKDVAVGRMKLRFGMEELAKARKVEVSDEEAKKALGDKSGNPGEERFEEIRWNVMMQKLVGEMIKDEG